MTVSRGKESTSDRDVEALSRLLYQRSFHKVTAYLRRFAHSDAEDLAHDAMLIVIQKLHEGELTDATQLDGYYFQTANNIAIAHYRKQARRNGIAECFQSDLVPEPPTSHQFEVEHEEQCRQVRDALSLLGKPRDKSILTQHYLLDRDKEAVRENLELTTSQYDRVLYNARRRLSQILTAQRSDLQAQWG